MKHLLLTSKLFTVANEIDYFGKTLTITHKSIICERGYSKYFGDGHIMGAYNTNITDTMAKILLKDRRIRWVYFSDFIIKVDIYKPFSIEECLPTINAVIARYMPVVWETKMTDNEISEKLDELFEDTESDVVQKDIKEEAKRLLNDNQNNGE